MSQTSVREASSLKIGVMLRGIDGKGGIGIYCQNLMDHLLAIDNVNRYILYYAKEEFLGRYKSFPNVEECYLKAPGRLVWDQLSVPRHARKNEVDVLFNTKLTVPLFTRCKTAMTVHGAGWCIMPQMYKRLDIAYVRVSQPLYCRKADAILSNSQCTTDDYIRILHIPSGRVLTVWLAAADSFKPCNNPPELEATRRQYRLPHRFILSARHRRVPSASIASSNASVSRALLSQLKCATRLRPRARNSLAYAPLLNTFSIPRAISRGS